MQEQTYMSPLVIYQKPQRLSSFLQTMDELTKARTGFMIARRLSPIKNAWLYTTGKLRRTPKRLQAAPYQRMLSSAVI